MMPATSVKQSTAYPRPRTSHRPEDLFREPAYPDGQPYAGDDVLEDDEAPGNITP
jgi:hypothetical protein